MAEEEYTQCKECGNKFPQPIKNRGKGYTENPRTWTIVVNGYCFSCCMKKGDEAVGIFNKVLNKYPEVKKAFEEYKYNTNLRTSAIMLD